MTASEIFARIHNLKQEGSFECYWCGAKCTDEHIHDGHKATIGNRRPITTALRPGSPYMCNSCWWFRSTGKWVVDLNGKVIDYQAYRDHSWFLTLSKGEVIQLPDNKPELLKILLKPPHEFILSFNTEEVKPELHLMEVNEFDEIKANDELKFTVDNKPLTYTVYELEESLKHGPEGKAPGVRWLWEALKLRVKKRKGGEKVRGRPEGTTSTNEPIRKVVTPT